MQRSIPIALAIRVFIVSRLAERVVSMTQLKPNRILTVWLQRARDALDDNVFISAFLPCHPPLLALSCPLSNTRARPHIPCTCSISITKARRLPFPFPSLPNHPKFQNQIRKGGCMISARRTPTGTVGGRSTLDDSYACCGSA